jgi:hypothetical protein
MTHRYLNADEAIVKATQDPDSVCLPIPDLILKLGFSEDELLGELRAGRLVAHAAKIFTERRPDGLLAQSVSVSFGALRRWADHPDLPQHLSKKLEFLLTGIPSQGGKP